MIRVTIFNEFLHEQTEPHIKAVYPNGIHAAIADFLGKEEDICVKTVTLFNEEVKVVPDCGITKELLDNTDVLIWWGHMHHEDVSDETVKLVVDAVHTGMGMIFLHSAHLSKPFVSLMGTTCRLMWRDDEKERLWNINPAHPIMRGIGKYFDLSQEEMYSERFDIPEPDQLLMIGAFTGYEVFRSACTWQRGNGKVFYFQPGHEGYPTYYNENVQTIIKNAVRWTADTLRVPEIECAVQDRLPDLAQI